MYPLTYRFHLCMYNPETGMILSFFTIQEGLSEIKVPLRQDQEFGYAEKHKYRADIYEYSAPQLVGPVRLTVKKHIHLFSGHAKKRRLRFTLFDYDS